MEKNKLSLTVNGDIMWCVSNRTLTKGGLMDFKVTCLKSQFSQ